MGARGEPVTGIASMFMFGDEHMSNQTTHKELGATPKINTTKPNINSGSVPLGPGHTPHTPMAQIRTGKID